MKYQADCHKPHSTPPYTLVYTNGCFDAMMERIEGARRLAIDTEADSLYHYFEKVCLLQLSTDNETFIIDPLTVTAIKKLGRLMSDPSIEKVFHAASYDILCLRRDYNFTFTNIFDTHMAGSLLGYEFLGLATMMEELLGVYHPKGCQRDDWSRRPLLAGQLKYAAMDTHHLLGLRDALEKELRFKGRMEWALEEFAAEAVAERSEKKFDPDGFRHIKGFRMLQTRERLALRALYLFRDEAAQKLDAPAFKVINNSVLMDLARRPPKSAQEMFKRQGVSFRVARRFGGEIVKLIAAAANDDPSVLDIPTNTVPKPPRRVARHSLELLKKWRLEKSEELKISVGVIFPANLLETVAATPPSNLNEFTALPGIRRWRVREFGQEILQILQDANETFESE